jgi:hypothetical protein
VSADVCIFEPDAQPHQSASNYMYLAHVLGDEQVVSWYLHGDASVHHVILWPYVLMHGFDSQSRWWHCLRESHTTIS